MLCSSPWESYPFHGDWGEVDGEGDRWELGEGTEEEEGEKTVQYVK